MHNAIVLKFTLITCNESKYPWNCNADRGKFSVTYSENYPPFSNQQTDQLT